MVLPNKYNKLRLIQWNAKSILLRYNELCRYTSHYNLFIISEKWLTADKSFIVKGFDTVRKDRENRKGGDIMILVNNSIKCKKITQVYNCSNKIKACAVEVCL